MMRIWAQIDIHFTFSQSHATWRWSNGKRLEWNEGLKVASVDETLFSSPAWLWMTFYPQSEFLLESILCNDLSNLLLASTQTIRNHIYIHVYRSTEYVSHETLLSNIINIAKNISPWIDVEAMPFSHISYRCFCHASEANWITNIYIGPDKDTWYIYVYLRRVRKIRILSNNNIRIQYGLRRIWNIWSKATNDPSLLHSAIIYLHRNVYIMIHI